MSGTCVGTASVYSGRPDPEWPVGARTRAALARLWDGLAPAGGSPPAGPGLGYRGVSLACPSGARWFAYGGVATLADARGVVEARADPGRRFERALLDTAPPGMVNVRF
jgi:hypothetical protein